MRNFTLNPLTDGVDHINIYSAGKTQLGQDLSNFRKGRYSHPELGDFMSVEGNWYYLSRRDERLRELWGFEAKKLGRELPVVCELPQEEFRRLIRLALDAKLNAHPEIKRALEQSTLPFAHYYTKHGRVDDKVKDAWILAHFEDVRARFNPQADMTNTRIMMAGEQAQAQAGRFERDQMSLF
ncbi:hypothetical protein ACYPKM_01800 [Pseudomonas aeruginosa]